uniref:WKF domain-containing protein n=1 Tax=Anopheles coluzzii TaxID=1518534 RepID=A0A8W7P4I7_ANOCL
MAKKNQIKTESVATAEKSEAMEVAKKKGKQQKRTENGDAQREKLGTKGAKVPAKSNEKLQKEALEYLDTWGKNRQEWKFSKLKQIYIQEHVFDDSFIGEEAWPIAVEYLSKTQGFARDLLTAKAKAIIKKGDVNMKVQDSANYKRARELLQCLG